MSACVVTDPDEAAPTGTPGPGGTAPAGAGSGGEGAAADASEAGGAPSAGASPGGATPVDGGSSGDPGSGTAGALSPGGAASDGGPAGGAPAGGASSGGTSAGGNSGGTAGEYVDADGRCRAQTVPYTTCPDNYADPPPNPCGSLCEGECGGARVQIRFCTPTQGCAYDLESGELIGMMFGDDVKDHCDGDSYEVVSGDWPYVPDGCTLTAPSGSNACPMGAISL